MTLLVTGGAGFLGPHVARAARAEGVHAVLGADVRTPLTAEFHDGFAVDLQDAQQVRALLVRTRPSHIIHLAGAVRGSDEALFAANVRTAEVMFDALESTATAATVVLLGSAAEYGAVPLDEQPVSEDFVGTTTSAYGQVKRRLAELARWEAARGRRVSLARPFNVIGAGVPTTLAPGALLHRILDVIERPPPRRIVTGRLSPVRDFVAAEDVARGLLAVAARGAPGREYNLCTGRGHSIGDLLGALLARARVPVESEVDPTLLRADDVDQLIGDPTRAKRELGWSAVVDFDRAVDDAWDSAVSARAR